jgi:DNA-binding transcriptional LysR family regulator
VAQLEAELGTTLFHRLGNTIELTDAGRIVDDYAGQVFDLIEHMQRALAELEGLERGYLRLGASSTPGLYLLPSHLAGFRTRYPGLDVTLHLGNSREIVAQVLTNALDLGFVEGYVEVAGLQVRPFATDELVFVAPVGHRLAGQEVLEPQDLAVETFIWREEGSGTREAMEAKLTQLGIEPARSLELRGCEGVKRVVAAGLGISLVSRHAVELELAQGLLAVLEGPDLHATQELTVVSHKDVRPSAAALAFLAHLRKVT